MNLDLHGCGLRGMFDATSWYFNPYVALSSLRLTGNNLVSIGMNPATGTYSHYRMGFTKDDWTTKFYPMQNSAKCGTSPPSWCEVPPTTPSTYCHQDMLRDGTSVMSMMRLAKLTAPNDGPHTSRVRLTVLTYDNSSSSSAAYKTCSADLDQAFILYATYGAASEGFWLNSETFSFNPLLAPCLPPWNSTLFLRQERGLTTTLSFVRGYVRPNATGKAPPHVVNLPSIPYSIESCRNFAYPKLYSITLAEGGRNIIVTLLIHGSYSFGRLRLFDAHRGIFRECNCDWPLFTSTGKRGSEMTNNDFIAEIFLPCIPVAVPCSYSVYCNVNHSIGSNTSALPRLLAQETEVDVNVVLDDTSSGGADEAGYRPRAQFSLRSAGDNIGRPVWLGEGEQQQEYEFFVNVNVTSGDKMEIAVAATHLIFTVTSSREKGKKKICRCDYVLAVLVDPQQQQEYNRQIFDSTFPVIRTCLAECLPNAQEWSQGWSGEYQLPGAEPGHRLLFFSAGENAETTFFAPQPQLDFLRNQSFCSSNVDFASGSAVVFQTDLEGATTMRYYSSSSSSDGFNTIFTCNNLTMFNFSSSTPSPLLSGALAALGSKFEACFPHATVSTVLQLPFVSVKVEDGQLIFTDSNLDELVLSAALCESTFKSINPQPICPFVDVAANNQQQQQQTRSSDSAFDYSNVIFKPTSTNNGGGAFSAGQESAGKCFSIGNLFSGGGHFLMFDANSSHETWEAAAVATARSSCRVGSKVAQTSTSCFSYENSCRQSAAGVLELIMCYATSGVSPSELVAHNQLPVRISQFVSDSNFSAVGSEHCSYDVDHHHSSNNNSVTQQQQKKQSPAEVLSAVIWLLRSFNMTASSTAAAAGNDTTSGTPGAATTKLQPQVKFVCSSTGEARLITCPDENEDDGEEATNRSQHDVSLDVFATQGYVHEGGSGGLASDVAWTRTWAAGPSSSSRSLSMLCTPCRSLIGQRGFPVSVVFVFLGSVANMVFVVLVNRVITPRVLPFVIKLQARVAAALAGESYGKLRKLRGGALRRMRASLSRRERALEWTLKSRFGLMWMSELEMEAWLAEFENQIAQIAKCDFGGIPEDRVSTMEMKVLLESVQPKPLVDAGLRDRVRKLFSRIVEERLVFGSAGCGRICHAANLSSGSQARFAQLFRRCYAEALSNPDRVLLEEQEGGGGRNGRGEEEEDDDDDDDAEEVVSQVGDSTSGRWVLVGSDGAINSSSKLLYRESAADLRSSPVYETMNETTQPRLSGALGRPSSSDDDNDENDDDDDDADLPSPPRMSDPLRLDMKSSRKQRSKMMAIMDPISPAAWAAAEPGFDVAVEESISLLNLDTSLHSQWVPVELKSSWLNRFVRPPALVTLLQLLAAIGWLAVCIYEAVEEWNTSPMFAVPERTLTNFFELVAFPFVNSSFATACLVNRIFFIVYGGGHSGSSEAPEATTSRFAIVLECLKDVFVVVPLLLLAGPLVLVVPSIFVFFPVFLLFVLFYAVAFFIMRSLPDVPFEQGRPVLHRGPGLWAFLGVLTARSMLLFLTSMLVRVFFVFSMQSALINGDTGWADTVSRTWVSGSVSCSVFLIQRSFVDGFAHLTNLLS